MQNDESYKHKLIIVHALDVKDQPRRWFIYFDSAERAIKYGDVKLHQRPRPTKKWYAWAIIEDPK